MTEITKDVKMPVLFVGHGSPMNAIEENAFTDGWRAAANDMPQPRAILVISAHWETLDTEITAMEAPKTIHDFYGFPQELFALEYPAKGAPALAVEIAETIGNIRLNLDWGLDHGAWSVLVKMFPNADIPVLQLSLDRKLSPEEHYQLGQKLRFLRERGVLIIGSGDIVHNLRMIDWRSGEIPAWALSANEKVKNLILEGEHRKLFNYEKLGTDVSLAIPTPEHFLPLIYALAVSDADDSIEFFNDEISLGSISMTCVRFSS